MTTDAATHAVPTLPLLTLGSVTIHNRLIVGTGKYPDGEYYLTDGKWFAETIDGLLKNPGAIGAHLCGGYIRNRFRRKGLVDEREQPDQEAIDEIQQGSEGVARWLGELEF